MSTYWYDKELESCTKAELAWTLYEHLYKTQTPRLDRWQRYTSQYNEEPCYGFSPLSAPLNHFNLFENETPSYNVTAICVDTLTSRLAANDPSYKIITTEGPESLQMIASQLEQLATGIMHSCHGSAETAHALRDCFIYGIGYVRTYIDNQQICIKRKHPAHVFADNYADCNPQTIYIVNYISREELIKQFPDKKEAILTLNAFRGREEEVAADGDNIGAIPDLIEVLEAYKLGTQENPGCYVCCAGKTCLIDVEYTKQHFPVVPIRFEHPINGYYSKGLAARLRDIQVQIDMITDLIGKNIDMWSMPYMLIDRSTKLDQEDTWVSNEYGRFLRFTGQPPVHVKNEGISEQVIRYLGELYNKAFEIARLSQLAAGGRKPAGIDSGIALRTYHDIETQGFADLSKRYYNFFSEVTKCALSCAGDLAKSTPGKKVKTIYNHNNTDVIKEIPLSVYNKLDQSSYVIRAYNGSNLPNTPAAKLQMVRELLRDGIYDPKEAREALDMPDIEKNISIETANVNYIKSTIEKMIETSEYIRPEPLSDLAYASRIAKSYYLNMQLKDEPDETSLNLLETYVRECEDLMEQMAPPAPPMPQGAPQGGPPMPQ
jgi:hypothetical protein